jgi:PKD repeat protein
MLKSLGSARIVVTTAFALALVGLTTTAMAAPAAPTGLAFVSAPSGVAMAWTDNSADETGFVVERCLGAACTSFGKLWTVGAGITTFNDSFAPTTTVRYRVRAINASGVSAESNIVEQSRISIGEVNASMTATPLTGVAPLTVSFTGSGTALNGTVTGFEWSFGDNQTASGPSVSSTYTVPGVYAASLKAVVTGGFNSQDCKSVNITVTAPVVPLAVATDLAANTQTRGQVLLTWTNPASSATSLALQRCSGSGCTNFAPVGQLTTASVFYKDTAIRRGNTYRYRLAASNATATVYSNVVSAQPR